MMWILYCLYTLTALFIIVALIIKYKINHSKLKWILAIVSTIMVIITGIYQVKIYQMNKTFSRADEQFGNYSETFDYYFHGESIASYLNNDPVAPEEVIFDDNNNDETKYTINHYKNMKKQLTIMKNNNTRKYKEDFEDNKALFKNCTIALYKTTSHEVLKSNHLLPEQNH